MKSSRLEQLSAPFAAIPHVWRASRWTFLFLSLFLILQGLSGPLVAVLLGKTVGAFSNENFGAEIPSLAFFWALLISATLSTFPAVFILSGRLNEDLTVYLQRLLLQRGLSIETMTLFDDPDVYDLISIVLKESKSRPTNYIVLYSYILRGSIAALTYIAILAQFGWHIPMIMLLSAFPLHHAFTSLREANWTGIRQRVQSARYIDYLVSICLQRETAMEVRSFEMRPLIRKLISDEQDVMLRELRRGRASGVLRNTPWILIGITLYVLAMLLLLQSASSPGVLVSGVAAGVQAFYSMQQAVTEVVENIAYLNEKAFFFRDLNRLMSLEDHGLPQKQQEACRESEASCSSVMTFSDVSFTYPNSPVPALVDIGFELRLGEVIAVVGKNGAGKSTLLKLVCGFYGPSSGSIYCNDSLLTADYLENWRSQISPIFQKTNAFALSFSENITLGQSGTVDEFQNAMDHAYGDAAPRMADELLGVEFGGTELSGGELQRLGIARAVFRDAPVVVLDEPTSAIDPIFERDVFSSIRRFLGGKSALLVTHRMRQALAADRVLVLDGGQIVEQGTPDLLLAQGGLFAQMVKAQTDDLSIRKQPRE